MDAQTLLERLGERGVVLVAAGDRLRFHPVESVSPDEIDALRRHKAELLALLPTVPPDVPPGAVRLMQRFRDGQAWLAERHSELDAMPNGGIGSTLEREYVAALDLIEAIENVLRLTYEYHGCARGQGERCDPFAEVTCKRCAGEDVRDELRG